MTHSKDFGHWSCPCLAFLCHWPLEAVPSIGDNMAVAEARPHRPFLALRKAFRSETGGREPLRSRVHQIFSRKWPLFAVQIMEVFAVGLSVGCDTTAFKARLPFTSSGIHVFRKWCRDAASSKLSARD